MCIRDSPTLLTLTASANNQCTVLFTEAGSNKFNVSHVGSSDKFQIYNYNTSSAALEIASNGNITVAGSLTAQNIIDIATDSTIQTTSARQWATIKNTGTGTGDYSEMKISNDNNDYLIMGSIGSGYTQADWANSSYIYANRELRIKSAQGIRFFSGGSSYGTHDYMVLDNTGKLALGHVSTLSSTLNVNTEISLGADANNRGILNYSSNILSFGTRQSSTNYFNTVKITSGTVGIGMSPTGNHKLEISQVGGDGISVHSGVDFGGIRLTDNNHSYAIRNAANKFFIYDVTNTTQRLTLDDSGNFGIGASAPVHDLHIHKTATGSQARIQFTNGNTGSTNADGYAIGMEATTRLYHWLYENSYMAFATNNAERMRILATGDIGIGTDAFTNNGGNKLSIDSATNAAPATSGTTQSGGALRLRGGDNAVLDFGLNSVNAWIQATDKSNLAGTYNLCLNPNTGKVGMGVPAPYADLHIANGTSEWRTSHGSTNLYTSLSLIHI